MSNIEETPSNTSDTNPDIAPTANTAIDTMESVSYTHLTLPTNREV